MAEKVTLDHIQRAAKKVVSQWNELGPDFGFEETVYDLEELIQAYEEGKPLPQHLRRDEIP